MLLNKIIIVILGLVIFSSCAKEVKKPVPEKANVYVPPPEPKVKSFFAPINSTDAEILKTCNKIVIVLYNKKESTFEITDTNSLSALLTLINGAESTMDHKCGPIAKLKIIAGGAEVVIDILSGHYEKFYEFRYGDEIYKIDRKMFFEINEVNAIKEDLVFLPNKMSK